MKHLDKQTLERYQLGVTRDEAQVARLEEHLLSCSFCAIRADATAYYVDMIRAAIIAAALDQQ